MHPPRVMAADAIIVAGGSGIRFGLKKQFLVLDGVPILKRTVSCFAAHPDIRSIIVVIPAEDREHAHSILGGISRSLTIVEGGATRQQSVWNGLMHAQGSEFVLIHDAVRPLVTPELITRVLDGINGFDACIPGLAVANTLKEVDRDIVVRTVPRTLLYGVQTPQCFRTERIRQAHEAARSRGVIDATDDSKLVEDLGGEVKVVEGDPFNLKITVKQDMELAEAILKCRSE